MGERHKLGAVAPPRPVSTRLVLSEKINFWRLSFPRPYGITYSAPTDIAGLRRTPVLRCSGADRNREVAFL